MLWRQKIMARITICDWCKEKFPSLQHNLCIDHFTHERQDGCTTSCSFEICSGCREEIKTRLESLEPVKKKLTRSSEPENKNKCAHNNGQGPESAWEISGNSGEILQCSVCGEKKKS